MVELLVVYCVWAHCILCLGAMHPSMNQRNYGLLEGRTSRVVGGLNREKDFFCFLYRDCSVFGAIGLPEISSWPGWKDRIVVVATTVDG